METKPGSDVRGWSEMVGEVPRCLTMQAAVHHDGQLVDDPLWHVQPMELTVKHCRQATVELPRVTDDTGGSIKDSLQLISKVSVET